MKSNNRLLALPITLALILSACNLNLQAPPNNPNQAAATIVAMTLTAVHSPTSNGLVAATPLASPAVSTPTTKPTLHINNNTPCRSGPAADAKVIASFTAGTTVDLIAEDGADGYWVVTDPATASLCWVAAQDGTPGGSFSAVPRITPPATALALPARPGSISYTYSCDTASLTTVMSWADTADNETGYHVYRQGTQIADLPANSSAYTDTTAYTPGTQVTYAVEAYNGAGASPQRSITFHCP